MVLYIVGVFYTQGRSKEIMCLRTTAPARRAGEKCIPYSIGVNLSSFCAILLFT